MKLYYSTATSSTPCHIALEEAGARYERVEVSWERHLNEEELERLNPLGAVPTLVLDDGQVLTQGLAILEHVADTHPQAGLLPAVGTPARAQVLKWTAFALTDLVRALVPLVTAEAMTTHAAAQDEVRAYAHQNVQRLLGYLDRELARGAPFVAGERFTIADAALWFAVSLSGWLESPLEPHAHVRAWLARVAARPATRRVLELEGLLE